MPRMYGLTADLLHIDICQQHGLRYSVYGSGFRVKGSALRVCLFVFILSCLDCEG